MKTKKLILLFFIIIGVLSLWLALKPEPIIKVHSSIESPRPQQSFSPSSSPTTRPSPVIKGVIPTPKTSFQISPTPQATTKPTPVAQATQDNQNPDRLQVNLSINNDSNLEVAIDSNSNQCDVLSKALEQGKISSLNMKYDDNLQSFAIYQINGKGSENSVWWVYEVNGQSPSKGCSFIKANSGDKVDWKYIGS